MDLLQVTDDGRDHSNRQGMFLALTITFTAISTTMVLLRVYTRAVIVRSFGNDDWAIIAAMFSMVAFCTISCLYIYHGNLGYHIWDFKLTPEHNLIYRKLQITNQLLYNPVLTLTKASILLFYERISPSVTFRRLVWATMAFNIAFAISVFVADLMQCNPIAYFWNKSIKGGTCFDVVGFYFATAGLSTFQDVFILIMPMPMVWRLHLPLRQRIILTVLFALGGVVCLMSVLRLVTFNHLYFITKDPSYSDASLWSPLECNIAIICASIPSFRPLISHYFPAWLSTTGSASNGPSSYKRSGSMPNVLDSSGKGGPAGKRLAGNSFALVEMGAAARSQGLQKLHDENDSEERIMAHMGVSKIGDNILYESSERKSGSFETSKSDVPR